MKRWLILSVVLASPAVFACEVLVNTSATLMTCGRANRRAILLQNKGANSLWCSNKSAEATSGAGVEVATGTYMSFEAPSSNNVWCSTSSLQSSGSGTRGMEL